MPNTDRLEPRESLFFLVSGSAQILQFSREFDGLGLASPLMANRKNAYVFSHPVSSDDVLWKFDPALGVTGFNAVHYDVVTDNFPCPFGCYDPNIPSATYSNRVDPDVRPLLPSTSLDTLNSELVQPSAQTARLRLSDGQKLWQRPVQGLGTAPVAGGVSYIPAGGSVEALNRDGQLIWRVTLDGDTRAIAKGNQQFYASTTHGFVYAFTTDGQRQWAQAIGIDGPIGAPVVAILSHGEELVMVAVSQGGITGTQHGLWAFRRDGTIAWFVPLDGPALGSPAISDTRIYVATQTSLYAIR